MPKANELKTGDVVDIDGVPHIVKYLESKSPSSRGAATYYKIRFNNLITGQKRDESYKADVYLNEADCQKVQVQLSYVDGDQYVFMDSEDYTQYTLSKDALEDQFQYLSDGLESITALLVNGDIAAIELPKTVVLEILETSPSIKGATANTRTKPAFMAQGLMVRVPEYVEQGECIKINTSNGKYMSRA